MSSEKVAPTDHSLAALYILAERLRSATYMASFTVRVELHAATYLDYETLHSKMEAQGFSRQITSDSGYTYHLPTAEYSISSDSTRSQVLEWAKWAVRATQKLGAVLVTESAGRTWDGLDLK